jgi:hypothetical protein
MDYNESLSRSMAQAENPDPPSSRSGAVPAPKKKTYQKPAFRYERVFETTALSCGKVSGTGGYCNINRKSS